jgi:hypothetical protein
MEKIVTARGKHPIIQPGDLSGPDIYVMRRIGNYYVYDSEFKPIRRSQNHCSPIIPISPGENTTYHLTNKLKRVLPVCKIFSDVEFLCFEFKLPNQIQVTLTSRKESVCECIFSPRDLLSSFLESTGSAVKHEDKHQGYVKHAFISVTESIRKKCTTRGGRHNDVSVEFSLFEIEIAVWLVVAVMNGRPYDQAMDSTLLN